MLGKLVNVVTVPTVVPDRLTVVDGAPMFAQSIPASPVAVTSKVRPAVVGSSAFVLVPDRFTVVVGLPMFAQSNPASPPVDTSRVRPAVVGMTADRSSIENDPTTSPTTD